MKKLLFILFTVLFFDACSTIDVYEKTTAFPTHTWSGNNKLSFEFEVTDTASLYNIYTVIRHADAYHYNNLYLNVTTSAPADTAKTQQVELLLGDNAKGWLGSAMDDIIEHRKLLTRNPVKLKAGKYIFTLQQTMREDPLENILNAGIRVEKAAE